MILQSAKVGRLGSLCQALLGLVETTTVKERSTVPTRNVNLTDELDRFVLGKVESGRYENAVRWSAPPYAPWRARTSSTS